MLPSIAANVNRVSVYVVKALKVIVLEETKRSGRVTISFEDEVAVLEASESNESESNESRRQNSVYGQSQIEDVKNCYLSNKKRFPCLHSLI